MRAGSSRLLSSHRISSILHTIVSIELQPCICADRAGYLVLAWSREASLVQAHSVPVSLSRCESSRELKNLACNRQSAASPLSLHCRKRVVSVTPPALSDFPTMRSTS